MKKLVIAIITLLCCFNFLNAQEITISGKIISEKNSPLSGATIELDKGPGAITNSDGLFQLEPVVARASYRLTIRMMGYATVDTLVYNQTNEIDLTIQLKIITYEQDSVEVRASGFNIFRYTDWKILDFMFHKDDVLILHRVDKKRKIGLYNLAGLKINELELDEKFSQTFVSCMGKIHLVGEVYCAELMINDGQISILKQYKRKLFDRFIKPCILSVNEELVFKRLSIHNKKAQYIKYVEPNEPVLLKEIYDQASAQVSQSYYNEIIGLYYQAIKHPEEGAIDEGIPRVNLIADGLWSGDLFDLIINNKLLEAVAYYKNVESREIEIREFEQDGFLFLLDFVNKKVVKIDVSNLESVELAFKGFNWNKKNKILVDKSRDRLYVVNKKMKIAAINLQAASCDLEKAVKLKLKGHFPEGMKIYKDEFYYFSCDDVDNRNSTLHKISLN